MGAQGSNSNPPVGSNPAMSQPAMGTATGKGPSSAPMSQPQMSAQTSADPSAAYSYTNPNNMQNMAQQFSGQNQMGQSPNFANNMQAQGVPIPPQFGQLGSNYIPAFNQAMEQLPGRMPFLGAAPGAMPAATGKLPSASQQYAGGYQRGGRVAARKISKQEMRTLAQALTIAKRVMGK